MRHSDGAKETIVEMNVVDKNGLRGHVIQEVDLPPNSDNWMLIQFSNGQLVLAPAKLLVTDDKGVYHLAASAEELVAKKNSNPIRQDFEGRVREDADRNRVAGATDELDNSPVVLPIIEERLKVEGRQVEAATVKIHKRVEEHTEVVDLPLQSEEVEVDRVAVNRIVEEAIPVRVEGDTTILSLLEEVLVVEKRLLLREEVHVRKVHKEVHAPQEVLLRKEEVDVERVPFSNAPDKGVRREASTQ